MASECQGKKIGLNTKGLAGQYRFGNSESWVLTLALPKSCCESGQMISLNESFSIEKKTMMY